MSDKFFSINPASGADSTRAQEPEVKSFSSSSANLNNVEVEEYSLDDYKSDYRDNNPSVYVSTFGKYASGLLDGAWLDITKFADYDEFMAVCRYLHRDEASPEFMFSDFEAYPRAFYSESCLDERTFDLIQEYAELDEDEREAFDDFMAYRGSGRDEEVFADFREAYCGKWDSEEEFTEQLYEDCGMLQGVPESLANYIDWKRVARDLFMCDYYMGDNGHIFRCM